MVSGYTPDQLAEVFAEWNKGELDSYLIEITATIFAKKDEDGQPLIDKILDTAGQKGTGKWTAISALDLGQPVTLIGESVFARCLSALKDERVNASKVLNGPKKVLTISEQKEFIEDVRRALYCSKMVVLRAGLYAPPRHREGPELEPQYGRHCADVARRLHHSQRLPRQHQGSLRQESRPRESPAR